MRYTVSRELCVISKWFYWQIMELEVLEYPKNRFRLEVSTLSLDEEWIGG